MRFYRIAFMTVLSLELWVLSGCRLDNPEWDTTWTIPITWSDLTPANIFGDSLVGYDPQRRVYFAYDKEVYRIPIDTLLQVPDTGFAYALSLPGAITIYPGNPLTVYNNYVVFAVQDFSVNQLIVGDGKVRIRAETAVQARVRVNYSAPKASLNGVPFSLSDTIPPAPPGGTSVLEREIDLKGYVFDLTGDDNLKANRLRILITAEIPPGDPPLAVPAGAMLVNTFLRFENIKPYFARGSIAPRTFELKPETLTVSLFNLVHSGSFSMTEPFIKIFFENGIGADLSARILSVVGLNSRTGQSVALNAPLTQGAILLGRAVNLPSQAGPYTPVFFESEASAANSNLKAFIENMPDKIVFQAKAQINPVPGAVAGQDFVYNISKTALRTQILFPMGFSFNQLLLMDTVPYKIQLTEELERIKSLKIFLLCENTYPFDLDAQVYILNDQGVVLDSLLEEHFIPSAQVSLSGSENVPIQKTLTGVLEGNRKDVLLNNQRLVWKLRFNGPVGTTPPVFYDFYKLKTRLVASAVVRI